MSPPPPNTPARPTTNIRFNKHPPLSLFRSGVSSISTSKDMNFFLNFLTTFFSRHSPTSLLLQAHLPSPFPCDPSFPVHLHIRLSLPYGSFHLVMEPFYPRKLLPPVAGVVCSGSVSVAKLTGQQNNVLVTNFVNRKQVKYSLSGRVCWPG